MVVAVLLTVDGLQVPVIAGESLELVGNTGAGSPEQIGAIGVKVGVIPEVISTVAVAVTGEQPGVAAMV